MSDLQPYGDLDTLAMVYLALGAGWQPNSQQPQVNRDLALERVVNGSDELSVRGCWCVCVLSSCAWLSPWLLWV